MADSVQGDNVMCHTLITNNLAVNFSVSGGNTLAIKFAPTVLSNVPLWKIYVHDKEEHLVLSTYAMGDIPFVQLKNINQTRTNAHKAKVKLLPKLFNKPGTKFHPCIKDDSYSQNECYLKKLWKNRVDKIKDYYGERFDCVLPGLMLDEKMPICTKRNSLPSVLDLDHNDTIGYVELMNPVGLDGYVTAL